MSLVTGTKLGPYEIVAPLGSGGMGEVYRARDTRLDRSVAVKILPAHLADRQEATERFEREARTISSLNHPNICQLHDIGGEGATRYLVMELMEGETLAERLRRGPLPLEQVLRYGAEIARGLDAAHRCGVVHRDLKPGNIMLTKSGAKLMDFGLAKGMPAPKDVSNQLTATLTSSQATPLTQQGTIVGTFQYMSPEQVEGKEADARSDIFGLGAVLYEMMSGRRAFDGKTLVSVAAAILEKEPEPMRTVQPMTPAALERVVKKCMAKDPEERWQSAADLASELRWIAEGGAPANAGTLSEARKKASNWMAWGAAALATLALIAMAVIHFAGRETRAVVRTQIVPPDKLQFNFVGDTGGPPVISPDGKRIVFAARSGGKNQLFLRSMDKLNPEPLGGTENAIFPFWSPDSRSIAFFADEKLKRLDLGGMPPIAICDAPIGRGGTWSAKGIIVFSPQFSASLYQVPASGGKPAPVTKLADGFTTHRWPYFLPDGEHFLYFAANHASLTSGSTAVFWASLDGKENKKLFASPSNAIYASDYLLYVRENAVVAQPFNPSSGELKGEPRVLNDDLEVDATVWRGTFSASQNGTLLYQPGTSRGGLRLTWFDRAGKDLGMLGAPDSFYQVELSPDDKRAVVAIGDPIGVIWVYDLVRNTRTRFTYGNGTYNNPLWSKDRKQIAFLAGEAVNGATRNVMVKSADGTGEEKTVGSVSTVVGLQEGLDDWSPDGRSILYSVGAIGVGSGVDLWVLPLSGDHKPYPYVTQPGDQGLAQFSPDGKWVAYVSNETGRMEVYVAPFPWTGAKWQISTNGGSSPRWRRDGREMLFVVPGSGTVVVADVHAQGPTFEVGEVKELFEGTNFSPSTGSSQYSMTSDGKRVLAITSGATGAQPLTVIENWTAQFERK